VHGGLSADHRDGARTDRFSRLDRGTIRAGALAYYPHHLAPPPAAPPPAARFRRHRNGRRRRACGRPAHGAGRELVTPGQPRPLPARRRPRQTSPTRPRRVRPPPSRPPSRPPPSGRRRAGRRRAGRPGRRRALRSVLLAHGRAGCRPEAPLPAGRRGARAVAAPGADAAAPPMIMGAYARTVTSTTRTRGTAPCAGSR